MYFNPNTAEDTVPGALQHVHDRLSRVETSQAAFRSELAENTKLTKDVQSSVSDLVDVLNALRGAFKVLETLGKIAKPVGYVAASVAAVWGAILAIKSGGDITPKP